MQSSATHSALSDTSGVIMILQRTLYQVSTLAGVRGQVGDTLLDLKTPGLFVVGERSSQCNTDDIEVRIISWCTWEFLLNQNWILCKAFWKLSSFLCFIIMCLFKCFCNGALWSQNWHLRFHSQGSTFIWSARSFFHLYDLLQSLQLCVLFPWIAFICLLKSLLWLEKYSHKPHSNLIFKH